MDQDPWAWTNQHPAAPMGNTLQVQQTPEMAAIPRQQGPLGMATQMVEQQAINKGIGAATDYLTPSTGLAPITSAPLASSPVANVVAGAPVAAEAVSPALAAPLSAGAAGGAEASSMGGPEALAAFLVAKKLKII